MASPAGTDLTVRTCYSLNPGMTEPTGRILEGERVFGCLQFGIGPSQSRWLPGRAANVGRSVQPGDVVLIL